MDAEGGVVSLHIYPELEQRSDEWAAQRRGMVTASVVGQLITTKTLAVASNDYSRALTMALVAERISDYTEPTYLNFDMMRGIEDEPRAVAVYSERYAPVQTCGFMVRDDWSFSIGYSPDGLVGDDGLIEVKSRRAKKQLQTVLEDAVPVENMAQIQCGLLVSGREWCDYVSFCGGWPLYVKRVEPDPEWHRAIVAAVAAFELAADGMVAAFKQATKGLPMTERPANLDELVI